MKYSGKYEYYSLKLRIGSITYICCLHVPPIPCAYMFGIYYELFQVNKEWMKFNFLWEQFSTVKAT